MSKIYKARDFVKQLNAGTLSKPVTLTGMVKDQDNADVLFFSGSGKCEKWIEIPVDSIEGVEYIEHAQCRDHTHPIVRVSLNLEDSKAASSAFLVNVIHELVSISSIYESLLRQAFKSLSSEQSTAMGCCGSVDTKLLKSDRRPDSDGKYYCVRNCMKDGMSGEICFVRCFLL